LVPPLAEGEEDQADGCCDYRSDKGTNFVFAFAGLVAFAFMAQGQAQALPAGQVLQAVACRQSGPTPFIQQAATGWAVGRMPFQ